MRVNELEGVRVYDGRDRFVGTVTRGVFHAEKPVLVGVEVRLRPWLHLIERPRRYVATSHASIKRSGVRLLSGKKPEREGANRTTEEWETAVVWVGQQVVTEGGVDMGLVGDVKVGPDGSVIEVELSGGASRNVAVGTRSVSAEHLRGFDGDVIRVADEALETRFSGGAAASAGKGAAVAKAAAGKVASAAAKGAVTAGIAAVKAARRSKGPGRLGGAWKGFTEGVKEGMRDEETRK